jgi:hypothetical protein
VSKQLPAQFYVAPFVIMAAAFAVGQGKEGAGVPVVILLSTMWAIYAVQRRGNIANG